MIRLEHVSKLYPARAERNGDAAMLKALDDVSLHVNSGEWVAVMGPSGSGKSTLVNLIGCLDQPTKGAIWLDGENVAELPASQIEPRTRREDRFRLPAVSPHSLSHRA